MSIAQERETGDWTAADLVRRFGPVPLSRIRHDPPPGSGTEADVVRIRDREDRLYELVDGVLMEKAMGTVESFLAGVLVRWLGTFATENDLGIVLPADGMMRLAPGLVRVPDVSFVSWKRLGGPEVPDEPIADLAPDLAIEVISRGNTRKEMQRKLLDYFNAGVRLVWYVYRRPRQEVWVYVAPDTFTVVGREQTLDGGQVLPGFHFAVKDLFAATRRKGK